MIEFLKRLFSQPSSSTTARERLRLVLMSDHLSLAPEMVDQMKCDLVDVISKYVEVDRSRIEVSFEEHDRALAMLANIPILSVHRQTGHSDHAGGDTTGPAKPPTRPGRRKTAAAETPATVNPAPAT
jgi:cell division topological specificity factor